MRRIIPLLLALCMLTALLLAGITGVGYAQSDSTESVEESTPVPPTEAPPEQPAETPETDLTPTPTRTPSPSAEEEEDLSSQQLFTIDGPITQFVSDLASRYGWDQIFFLGLSVEDWINLALSILIFFLMYLLGRWLINRVLGQALKRTRIEKDEEFLEVIRPQINWLMLTIALQLSLARLDFLSEGLRVLLNQAFFITYLTIITVILWKLIGFATEALLHRDRSEEDVQRLTPIYMVAKRVAEALLLIGYFSIALTYFGVDITAFAASLGIAGLAISLAAQDTLADAIAGFLILLDQPFRVGDRIEISGLGTWGDVVEIGTRSTRIRTRDNRLVIVPNSAIAKDQVVNYTYPDPRYRVQIEVGIDYDSDLKLAREAAIKAVNQVDGVLLDKPVDALFVDFGDSAITFRIRWWIDSYVDTRRMFDKVNEELLKGFNQAGIILPNMTYDLNLTVDEQNVRQFSEAVGKDNPTEDSGKISDQN
ncbi:MAG: mechanosensitive ion channel family protein [Chloroflexota bacterium]|nr:MAG: mechanosensitive ion channel family protein [Chloroflexota bacterium]